MTKTTEKSRLSDTIVANARESLERKQEEAIKKMADDGKYDTKNNIAKVKPVHSSS